MKVLKQLSLGLVLQAVSFLSLAEVAMEVPGKVENLAGKDKTHWAWSTDPLIARVALIDLDSDYLYGAIDGSWSVTSLLFPKNNSEFYVPETHYEYGSRGKRHDFVTFYDSDTLSVITQVEVPTKRAANAEPTGNSALSDDDHFIALFNMTPAQSISIVDAKERKFVSEFDIPGCALVYPAGNRRFLSLCGDGSALVITLDKNGEKESLTRTEKFFDPDKDPIIERGVRSGGKLLYVSYEGYLYTIDVSGETITFEKPWSLLSEKNRKNSIKVGGRMLITVHAKMGWLYVLLHEGGGDTHKHGGTELGVYDLKQRKEIKHIDLESPGFTFSGVPMAFGEDLIWPISGLYDWIGRIAMSMEHQARPESLMVTQDEHPLLAISGAFSGSIGIYDAKTLEFKHRVTTGNITTIAVQTPNW